MLFYSFVVLGLCVWRKNITSFVHFMCLSVKMNLNYKIDLRSAETNEICDLIATDDLIDGGAVSKTPITTWTHLYKSVSPVEENRPCVDKECITRCLTGNFSHLHLRFSFAVLTINGIFSVSLLCLTSEGDCKFFNCFPAVKRHWTFADLFAEQMVEGLWKTMSRFIVLHFGLFPPKPITQFQKSWIKQLEYKLNGNTLQ